tara:strand:- start:895 stop:2493 length:1599 start_codon:yes stop_codon:yes gene_type:complete
MNKLYKAFLLLIVAGLVGYSCEGIEDSLVNDQLEDNPLPEAAEYNSGSADFSKYVAIGNSLTAGYMDGALYTSGQSNSIGAMLASSFAATSAGDYTFNQPDINSVNGYNTNVAPAGNIVFGRFKLDTSIPGPSPTINGDAITAYSGGQPLNNFGVPGIQVGQLLTAGTGTPGNAAFNPFYARFASSPGTSTILGDVIAAQPTFFSLWIGNNDVLGYATGGASNPAILTSNADFQTRFSTVVGQLMANTTADGMVANIPSFLGLAYFRAVSWNAIPLDADKATLLNTGLAGVNGALQALADNSIHAQADIDKRKIAYAAGSNPILVIDETLEDLGPKFDLLGLPDANRQALVPYEQSRPLVSGELVVLSAASVVNTSFGGDANKPVGIVIPLGFNADGSLSGDKYYLTLAEQVEIETSRQTFNGMIAAVVNANSSRLALYDINASTGAFADIFGLSDGVPGITVDGVDLSPDFAPSGVISTDGIHPNPRGNALIVNEMIDVIEAKFGSTLPSINVLNKASVTLCVTGDCLSEQ